MKRSNRGGGGSSHHSERTDNLSSLWGSDDEMGSENGTTSDLETDSGANFNFSENGEARGLEYLIPFINKLLTVFRKTGLSQDYIQLPQIVVVGSQSSGKSSVLESLVGKSFLPRGTGIVTRCPIVLKLEFTKTSKEWCEFVHQPKKKYYDFKEVQQEIVDQTKKIAGQNGITKESIQLTVKSPNVVTLTVVDLPGIVKISTFDQPEDIERQIRELILHYITPKNSIILAVSSANNDIATSDSLQMARQVDPNGERTMAVITKLDLASDKTQMSEVLKGNAISKVKLGVVGVINRNQEEIDRNKSIPDALESEKKFLITNYPSIASQHGTPFLAQRLNRELLKHIETCFPELDMRLKQLEVAYKSRLDELGHPFDLEEGEKRDKLIDILSDFASSYKAQVDGRCRGMGTTKVSVAARVDLIFQTSLINALKQLSPVEDLSNREIIIAIRNSRPTAANEFGLEDAFGELVKRQIEKMRQPLQACANQIYHEMINVVPHCLAESAERFPKVNRAIIHILSEILHQKVQHTRQTLEQYINIQASAAITAQTEFYEKMEVCNEIRVVENIRASGLGKIPLEILLEGEDDTLLKPWTPSNPVRVDWPVNTANINTTSGGEALANHVSGDPDSAAATSASSTTEGLDVHEQGSSTTNSSRGTTNSRGSRTNNGGSGNRAQIGLTSEQIIACDVVRMLMEAFFDIVLKQVLDYAPKSILHTMVYSTVDNVDKELIKKLALPEKISELMKESERIISIREAVKNDLQALVEACQELEEVREKSAF